MGRSVYEAQWILAPIFGTGIVFVAVGILIG